MSVEIPKYVFTRDKWVRPIYETHLGLSLSSYINSKKSKTKLEAGN
jgi:hypothetical protein